MTGSSKQIGVEADESQALIAKMLLPQTDQETFFLLYSRLLQVRFGIVDIEFLDTGVLSAQTPDGKKHTLYLQNLWLVSRGDLEEGIETIERYLKVFEPFDGKELISGGLVHHKRHDL